MPGGLPTNVFFDALTGWRGAAPGTRALLLRALCSGVRLGSLVSNSLTLVILAGLIIAESRDPQHAVWVGAVILGGLLPRMYAARLRKSGDFSRGTDRKALGFLAVSAFYGLIWGVGPFIVLPEIHGVAQGIFLFMMVFGTIMGPYAVMPGILYVRLATTGGATLVATAMYSDPRVAAACLVVSVWLALRTDIWRGYHRTLRRQFELQQELEERQRELELANQANVETNRRLRRMAETDPLTGAFNRRELMRRLRALSGQSALVLFDVDHFKEVNDSFGHQVGDRVLIELVTLVQGILRRGDTLARIGGEEFAVVLAETEEVSAWTLAERIRTCINGQTVEAEGHRVRVTVSVGVAMVDSGAGAGRESALLAAADEALYEAKRKGRNRTELAAPGRQVLA